MDRVPITVDQAIAMFVEALDDDEKKTFKDIGEGQIALFHHTFGAEIRNCWSLHEPNTWLTNSFKEIGITHADDMSGIIMISAKRFLSKKPMNIESQVNKYKKYWQKEIGKPMP